MNVKHVWKNGKLIKTEKVIVKFSDPLIDKLQNIYTMNVESFLEREYNLCKDKDKFINRIKFNLEHIEGVGKINAIKEWLMSVE